MEINYPLVSIIIPTFNRAHLIGETLDSILAQTYENWECIIVDDGSTDNTSEVVKKYLEKDNRFQFHHRPKDLPKGGNAARNYGFELSKGEYVNWFDDDDIMLEDFILARLNLLKSYKIEMVICSGFYVDENLQKKEKIDLRIETFLFKDYVRWKVKILTPSILFKKSFLKNKDLFSLQIIRGQESELFSRLFYNLSEDRYEVLNVPLLLYRQHKETKSGKNCSYVNEIKESQAKVAVRNFKFSVLLRDFDLINYYYIVFVDFFYDGINFKHFDNCFFILKKGMPKLYQFNKFLVFQFYIAGYFFLFIKKGSYKFRKYFKNQQIKYFL